MFKFCLWIKNKNEINLKIDDGCGWVTTHSAHNVQTLKVLMAVQAGLIE